MQADWMRVLARARARLVGLPNSFAEGDRSRRCNLLQVHLGPSLSGFANRQPIAGVVPDTSDNLLRRIQDPREVKPGTAMPNLGVTESDARNIAASLYALR